MIVTNPYISWECIGFVRTNYLVIWLCFCPTQSWYLSNEIVRLIFCWNKMDNENQQSNIQKSKSEYTFSREKCYKCYKHVFVLAFVKNILPQLMGNIIWGGKVSVDLFIVLLLMIFMMKLIQLIDELRAMVKPNERCIIYIVLRKGIWKQHFL